jgi:hypothetical protein
VLALAGCAGEERPAVPAPAERDVRSLAARMLELHPGLAPGTAARAAFTAEADALAARADALTRAQLVVEVMRLTALGDRNGHTGVFVFHPHARPLHVYPLRLYDFPDGLWVVDADEPSLVGRRLTAIEGVPVARIVEAARPLVPRDNDASVRLLLPEVVVTEEALVDSGSRTAARRRSRSTAARASSSGRSRRRSSRVGASSIRCCGRRSRSRSGSAARTSRCG